MKKTILIILLASGQSNSAETNLPLQVLDTVAIGAVGTAATFYTLATLVTGIFTYGSIKSYYKIQHEKEKAQIEGREYFAGIHYTFEINPETIKAAIWGTAEVASYTFLFWRAFKQLVIPEAHPQNFRNLSFLDKVTVGLIALTGVTQLYGTVICAKECVEDIKWYKKSECADEPFDQEESLDVLKDNLKRHILGTAFFVGTSAAFFRAAQKLVNF